MDMKMILERDPELKDLYERDPRIAKVLDRFKELVLNQEFLYVYDRYMLDKMFASWELAEREAELRAEGEAKGRAKGRTKAFTNLAIKAFRKVNSEDDLESVSARLQEDGFPLDIINKVKAQVKAEREENG
ncbi:MAG: hypothetical protein LBS60_11265 [Deltaproteobacteria bacterium]|nr:hypothetical protein [Deltaproteobacteria bacterium]